MLVMKVCPAELVLQQQLLAPDHDTTDQCTGGNGQDQQPVERESQSRSGQRDPKTEIARIAGPRVSTVRHENRCGSPRLDIAHMPLNRKVSGNAERKATG